MEAIGGLILIFGLLLLLLLGAIGVVDAPRWACRAAHVLMAASAAAIAYGIAEYFDASLPVSFGMMVVALFGGYVSGVRLIGYGRSK